MGSSLASDGSSAARSSSLGLSWEPLGVNEVINQYDLVLTPSKWGADILCSELAHEKVEVVPLGVDPKIFSSEPPAAILF